MKDVPCCSGCFFEIIPLTTATSATTIESLRGIFATHGLPSTFVTDNGSQFTIAEFQSFMEKNGIRHLCSAPYHPATNGLAERAVQSFKGSMEKNTDGSRVSRFLFLYRQTPHTTTGVPPAELLLGRIPRSHLDLLKPDVSLRVKAKQRAQQENHDIMRWANQCLSIRKTGVIFTVEGPRSYLITLSDDRRVRRHVDHVRKRTSEAPTPATEVLDYPLVPTGDTVTPTPIPPSAAPATVPARRFDRNVPPPNYLTYGRNFEQRQS